MDDELPTADDEDSFDAESDDFEADDCELSSEELEDWGGSELEEAYLKALSALEASDSEMANSSDEDVEETTEELTEDHVQDAVFEQRFFVRAGFAHPCIDKQRRGGQSCAGQFQMVQNEHANKHASKLPDGNRFYGTFCFWELLFCTRHE